MCTWNRSQVTQGFIGITAYVTPSLVITQGPHYGLQWALDKMTGCEDEFACVA